MCNEMLYILFRFHCPKNLSIIVKILEVQALLRYTVLAM